MKALDILQDLLSIDTRNPPGNEIAVVDFIEALCREVALDHERHAVGTDRSSIIVRLAPACEERLVIHARFDAKYFVAVVLSILVSMKPQEASLTRGITCLFTADEEDRSSDGLPGLPEIESIRRELTGRTVLHESGGYAYEYDGVWYSMVATGHRSVCRLQVSVPEIPGTNPYFPTLDHEQVLVRAIRAVQAVELPSAVPETAVNLLTRFSQGSGAATPQEQMAHVKSGGDDVLYRLLFAMSHSMITPTVIRGGSRNPELAPGVKASVVFDCRLLPEIGEAEFIEAVGTALAGMPVELSVLLFSPGDKDGKHLRPLGCDVLGFPPLAFCTDVMSEICRNYVHGRDYYDLS